MGRIKRYIATFLVMCLSLQTVQPLEVQGAMLSFTGGGGGGKNKSGRLNNV